MRLCVLVIEKAPELLHTISILPVLKEVHLLCRLLPHTTKVIR
jgi:hypothetical protein